MTSATGTTSTIALPLVPSLLLHPPKLDATVVPYRNNQNFTTAVDVAAQSQQYQGGFFEHGFECADTRSRIGVRSLQLMMHVRQCLTS